MPSWPTRDGFVLVNKETSSPSTKRCWGRTSTRRCSAKSMFGDAASYAKNIAKLEGESGLAAMPRPRKHEGKLASKLHLLCRSNKERGKVEFRSIHNSVGNAFEGLSQGAIGAGI